MKNIFLVLFFAFLSVGSIYAQDKNKIEDTNYCILLDEKIFVQQDGEITQLSEAFTLKNGTVLQPDGSYQLSNNTKAKLKDGECLGFSGKFYESQEKLNAALLKMYKKRRR